MKKFTTLTALILVAVMALSTASCRNGDNGKDTTTDPGTSAPTSSSIAPEDTTTETPAADTTTEAPKDTTTEAPKDTTTPAPKDTTTAPTTTAPTKIEWKDANMTVYVSVENAWVRKSPDLDDASRVEVLHLRDALTCTATSDSWMKVTYGGETRYISASCVTKDDISGNDFEKVNDKVYVTVSSVWLRLAQSTETAAIGYAKKGDQLTRTAKGADWSEVVNSEGKTCYVSNSCISTTKPQ